jgi:hypothetical protein
MGMIRSAAVFIAVLIGATATLTAEDLDVITLRDGRVLEGHYNEVTGVIRTVQGKVKASFTIAPEDIVCRTTKTVPDAPDPEDAPAQPAHPVKIDAAEKAQRAQRVEDLVAREQLVKDLADATDQHRKLQAAIDQDESDQKEIPNLVKDLDQHIADTHDLIDRDIVREAQVTAANPGSQAETDARLQHDHDQEAFDRFSSDEKTLKKKLATIAEELPGLRTQFKDSTARQMQAQAALDALDGSAEDDPIAALAGSSATSAATSSTAARPAGK